MSTVITDGQGNELVPALPTSLKVAGLAGAGFDFYMMTQLVQGKMPNKWLVRVYVVSAVFRVIGAVMQAVK